MYDCFQQLRTARLRCQSHDETPGGPPASHTAGSRLSPASRGDISLSAAPDTASTADKLVKVIVSTLDRNSVLILHCPEGIKLLQTPHKNLDGLCVMHRSNAADRGSCMVPSVSLPTEM